MPFERRLARMTRAPRKGRALRLAFGLALIVPIAAQSAGCMGDGPRGGILGLDKCDEFEASGIFSRSNQRALDAIVILGTAGTALWEGTDSEIGRTAWKSADAMVTSAITTETLKLVTQRPRPSQSDDPDLWRQGSGNKSFPSGETAMIAASVTPIIMDYQDRAPAVWALAVLPMYMAKARTGSQAHWTSDVLFGVGVGVATGYFAGNRESPLLLTPWPGGVFVGLRHRF